MMPTIQWDNNYTFSAISSRHERSIIDSFICKWMFSLVCGGLWCGSIIHTLQNNTFASKYSTFLCHNISRTFSHNILPPISKTWFFSIFFFELRFLFTWFDSATINQWALSKYTHFQTRLVEIVYSRKLYRLLTCALFI